MVPRALNRGSSRGGLLRRFEVSKPTHPFDIAAMNAVPIDHDFLLHTASTLVGIDSRNPELEAGAPGEREIAEYVAGVLTGFDGWQVELQALEDRRANVVAVRPGAGDGPSLMINAHLDTVGTAGMSEPFSGAVRSGRIHGRGAQDTKGGVAAALATARALSEAGAAIRGDVVLAFVADEEHASLGTREVIRRRRTDAAIVIEPTGLDVCVAHRGFGVFELRTHGRTAHGGRSDLGIDANLHMGAVLADLRRLRDRWKRRPPHPLLGTPDLHLPLIRGGEQLYSYAGECVAHLEVRTVPGQSEAGVTKELEEIFADLTGRVEDFVGEVRPVLWRGPHEIEPGRPIVRRVVEATTEVRHAPPRLIGHGWWEDSGLLGAAGIDTVILGPLGAGLHTAEEWVDIESVVHLAEILVRTTLSYAGRPDGREADTRDAAGDHDDDRGNR